MKTDVLKSIKGIKVMIQNSNVVFNLNKTQICDFRDALTDRNKAIEQVCLDNDLEYKPQEEKDYIETRLTEKLDAFRKVNTNYNDLIFKSYTIVSGKAKRNDAQNGLLNALVNYAKNGEHSESFFIETTDSETNIFCKVESGKKTNWKQVSLTYLTRADKQQGKSKEDVQKEVNERIEEFNSKIDLNKNKSETKNVINQ